MKDFSIELSIGEFHMIYSALLDKKFSNEKVMESLIEYDATVSLYDEKISDPDLYARLVKQNAELQTLIDELYRVTGAQL